MVEKRYPALQELWSQTSEIGICSLQSHEPGTDFDIGVHEVILTENTIKDNARFFENDINKVPKKAITMGIKNILSAEVIILIANGKNKAKAIKNIMSGVVDNNVPASALNLHNGKVYVIIDKEAASLL